MAEQGSGGNNVSSPSSFSGLCKQGCGFYGNSQCEGMCSKCYKDCVARQQSKDVSAIRDGQQQQQHHQADATTVLTSFPESLPNICPVASPLCSGALPTVLSATAPSAAAGAATTAAAAAVPTTISAVKASSHSRVTAADLGSPIPMNFDLSATPEKAAASADIAAAPSSPADAAAASNPDADATAAADADAATASKKRRRNRCAKCAKKIGLLGFECRCGQMYCSVHRYSDAHACLFDFQGHGQALIRQANPQIQAPKVDKI